MNRCGLRARAVAWGLALLGAASPAAADEPPVVLLLSGGGARGAAHVGVLKVLEQERVRVDAIVGTSMGALVGGLYAAGLSAAEIERTMTEADWDSLFRDRPERPLEGFRRKRDERDFLVRGRIRLDGFVPRLPLGAIEGRHVTEMLRGATRRVAGIDDFSRLPIPFRAVATDLRTGEAVVLERGDLVTAMRASMAVPGVFAPVTIDGRPLVDGGISENLAIGAATRDRPVRLIAVDIASRPLPVEELSSPASVLNQAVTLLMMRENARQVDRLGPGDLLIQPALGEFSSSAFALAADAIAIGEQSARAEVDRLREYAVPVDEYAAWREGRSVPPAAAPRIAAVEVRGPDVAAARAARRRLEKLVGDALDEAQLRREVERARATDLFESVDLVLDLEGASDVRVVLDLEPRTRGADALLFGLRLRDDFEGGTSFDVGARWLNRGVGSHDLDLRVDVVGGERQRAALSAFRPVGDEHLWFVESGGGYREEPFVLFVDATTFFQFRRRDLFAFVDFGTDLGSWGEARLGVEQRWSRLRRSSELGLQIGQLRFDETLGRLRFGVDTFDEVTFPSTGTYVRAELARVFATDLDERGVVFAELVAQRAASFGAHRFVGGLELQDNLDGTPVFPRAAAGGLFRLSGYAENELRGSKLAIAHLRWARELAGSGARMPIFAGASLELGDVLSEAQDWDVDALRLAGSLYLGIDSVLGPVFIHVGLAEEGRRSWAFSLGRRLF